MISDALDSDPFELMRVSSTDGSEGDDEEEVNESVLLDKKKNREMIDRFKVSISSHCATIYVSKDLSPLTTKLVSYEFAEYDECHIM